MRVLFLNIERELLVDNIGNLISIDINIRRKLEKVEIGLDKLLQPTRILR